MVTPLQVQVAMVCIVSLDHPWFICAPFWLQLTLTTFFLFLFVNLFHFELSLMSLS